jgi:hypothetical protein
MEIDDEKIITKGNGVLFSNLSLDGSKRTIETIQIKIKVEKIEIPIVDLNKLIKEKDDTKMDIRYHIFSSVFSI